MKLNDAEKLGAPPSPATQSALGGRQDPRAAGFPKAVTVPARCLSGGSGPRPRTAGVAARGGRAPRPQTVSLGKGCSRLQTCPPWGQQGCPARARPGQRSHAEPGTPKHACTGGGPPDTAAQPSPRAMGGPATGRDEHVAAQLSVCATLGDAGLPTSPAAKPSSVPSPHPPVKHLVSRSQTCPPSPPHWAQRGDSVPTSRGWRRAMLLRPTQGSTGMEPGHLPAHERYKASRSLAPAAPQSPALWRN